MGFLSKLVTKKADAATEPALVATKTEPEETPAAEVPAEEAPAEEAPAEEEPAEEEPAEEEPAEEAPTEEAPAEDAPVNEPIQRSDSTISKKTIEPEGLKTFESRNPEADMISTSGSQSDAPAATASVVSEPRESEGLDAPEPEAAANETEGLAPADAASIDPASPKQSAPTSIFDAISNCGCLFGNTVAQTEDSVPQVEDTPQAEETVNEAPEVAVASSMLGAAKSQEVEEDEPALGTPDLGHVATVSKQESIVDEPPEDFAEDKEQELGPLAVTEPEDVPRSATEVDSIQPVAEDETTPTEETSASIAEEQTEDEKQDAAAEADAATEPAKKKKSRHFFAWLSGCRSEKSTIAAIETSAAEKELAADEEGTEGKEDAAVDAQPDAQEEKSVVLDDKETEAEVEMIPSAEAENETTSAAEISSSIADEQTMEEKQNAVAEADGAADEPAKKKKSRLFFAWLSGCRSAKSTVSAIEPNTAEKELTDDEDVADVQSEAHAESIAIDQKKTEDVNEQPDTEEGAKLDETEIQKTTTVETKQSTIAEETVSAPQDANEEEDKSDAETKEAAEILPTTSALSDQTSSSKKSKLGLLFGSLTRSKQSEKTKEQGEVQGMVRFMSHTERFERGFEVLLEDFSCFARQCGGSEIKTQMEAVTDVADDEAQPERSDSATRAAEETEAEARDEQPEHKEEAQQNDQPSFVSKQSRSSRISFRSILGKKSTSKIPVEVQDIAVVPSKDMSTLSRGTMEAGDEVKSVAGAAVSAE